MSSVFISGKVLGFQISGDFGNFGISGNSSNRRQHVFRAGVIAEGLAHVDEDVFIAGREDEAAAELERVFAQAMLLVAGSLRAAAGLHVVSAQKVEQGSVAQFNRFVSFAFFVDQQRKLGAAFLAEEFGVAHVAQPDRGQTRALTVKLFFEFAQLRDVLAAEDSTIMAKKDDDRGAIFPQRTQANGVSVHIGQRDSRQLAAERLRHVGHCLGSGAACQAGDRIGAAYWYSEKKLEFRFQI